MNLSSINWILLTVFSLFCIQESLTARYRENMCLKSETFEKVIFVDKEETVEKDVWCISWTFRCKKKYPITVTQIPQVVNRTRIVLGCCSGYVKVLTHSEQFNCVPECHGSCKLPYGECTAPNVCSCQPGYYGTNCVKSCPPGLWGKNCYSSCNCLNKGHCNIINGHCSCQPGWIGERCETSCPQGFHGFDCKQKCNCSSLACDPQTGECLQSTTEYTTIAELITTTTESTTAVELMKTMSELTTTTNEPITTMIESTAKMVKTIESAAATIEPITTTTEFTTTAVGSKTKMFKLVTISSEATTTESVMTTLEIPQIVPSLDKSLTLVFENTSNDSLFDAERENNEKDLYESTEELSYTDETTEIKSSTVNNIMDISTKKRFDKDNDPITEVQYKSNELNTSYVTSKHNLTFNSNKSLVTNETSWPNENFNPRFSEDTTHWVEEAPNGRAEGETNEKTFNLLRFIPSVTVLSGVSIIIIIIGARWLIGYEKRKTKNKRKLVNLSPLKYSQSQLFQDSSFHESSVSPADAYVDKSVTVLQTFKPQD